MAIYQIPKLFGNTASLISGTVLSQVVGIIFLPFLTRLYTPEHFGIFAAYMALVALVGGVSCLKFEVAMNIADNEKDADSLFFTSFLICGFASLFILALAFSLSLYKLIYPLELEYDVIFSAPLGIFLGGQYLLFTAYLVRKKSFKLIAKVSVLVSVIAVTTQLISALIGIESFGLILGHISSLFFGVVYMAIQSIESIESSIASMNKEKIKVVAKKYIRFPKHGVFEDFCYVGTTQIPMMILAAYGFAVEVGVIFLARRAMVAPVRIVSGAASKVFVSDSSSITCEVLRKKLVLKYLSNIYSKAIGPLLIFSTVCSGLIPLVFGEEWIRAGTLITWMVPWFIFLMLGFPITSVVYTAGLNKKQQQDMVLWLLVRVVSTIVAIYIAPDISGETYAFGGGLQALYFLIKYLKVVNVDTDDICNILKSDSKPFAFSLVICVVFIYAFRV